MVTIPLKQGLLSARRQSVRTVCRQALFGVLLVLSAGLASAGGYASVDTSESPTYNHSQQLWYRLSMGFELPPSITHPEVKHWLAWYQKHPAHIGRLQRRSAMWLGYVLQEVEKHDMPTELALLPAVESAYDPLAYSHGRASGLWQFIPNTAKHLGLENNWWYDARRDVPQSTAAALKYLAYLHRRFDNWLHALAAYNAGEGNVSAAIRRNKKSGLGTDFWSLKLPSETRAYVPKLLALAEIIRDPALYGVELRAMPNNIDFAVVDTGGQLDLAQAAQLAALSADSLRLHNPGLNRWATPPNGPHRLLMPKYAAKRFSQALAQLPAAERVSWKRHKVKSGESLSEIAHRYGSNTQLIKEINRLRGTTIKVGQQLLVAVGQTSLARYPSIAPQGDGSLERVRKHYQVKSGDSLWVIARRHNVRVADIQRWNDLEGANALHPGQELLIWMPKGAKLRPLGPTHTVVAGDNLWDLSRKYKISVDKLAKWNGLKKGELLSLGQIVRLTAPKTSASSNAPIRRVTYAVRSGDSLDRIARKFGVSVAELCDWNNINPRRYLKPGQRLRVLVPITEQWRDV